MADVAKFTIELDDKVTPNASRATDSLSQIAHRMHETGRAGEIMQGILERVGHKIVDTFLEIGSELKNVAGEFVHSAIDAAMFGERSAKALELLMHGSK